MAKHKEKEKKEEKHEIEKVPPVKTGSGRLKKIIIIAVIVLVCAAVSAAAVYFLKIKKTGAKYQKREYKNLTVSEEVIKFAFDEMPSLYFDLTMLNDAVDRMDSDIKRFDEIEAKYPKQKKILTSEKKNLERLKKIAASAIAKIEKEVEAAFVMFLVEESKGRLYAKEKQPELEQLARDSLSQIKVSEPEKPAEPGKAAESEKGETAPEGEEKPKGFIQKIKSLFGKG
jgi:flagellar basal body-associated protein FliL